MLTTLAAAVLVSVGYEEGMPNLVTPALLEPGKTEFQMQHRFLGEAFDDVFDTFLGADLGANISLGLRSFVAPGVELDLSHTRVEGEYTAGAGYNATPPSIPADLHASISWYSVETGADEREDGFLALASLQSERMGGLATFCVNYAYDTRAERHCAGFGMDASLTPSVSLQGEYWPGSDGAEGFEADSMDCWCAGVRMNTWGHQFGLVFGNSWDLGARSLASGTSDDKIRMGLTIRRQLSI